MQPTVNKTPPRKRRWRLWLPVGAVLVCATGAVLIHLFSRASALERLKQQIRSAVPIGSTRAQVEAWAHDTLGGRIPNVTAYPLPDGFPGPTIAGAAGVPVEQRATVLDVTVPCGWYVVNGQAAPNNLWVYFMLNASGEVVDYHFLTLEELAQIERMRLKQRAE